MHIAAFRRGRWPEAARILGHTCVELPPPPNAGTFESSLSDRIEHGRRLLSLLKGESIDLIVDVHGDGMLFVDDPATAGMSALLHHTLGVPLVSHWGESLRVLFKRMDPALLLEALQSRTWFKGVFTQAHLAEMAWMGIGGCFYLPINADDPPYPTDPPSIDRDGAKVLFAGRQQSRYFAHSDGVDVRTQWPGAMALAAVSDGSASTFLEAYRLYELGPCPASEVTFLKKAEAVQQYYARKLFFIASQNLAARDRFIYYLQKRLGPAFLLIGDDRWEHTYGLTAQPEVERGAHRNLIRSTPICINMVNGDNDTGLNLRHFEVTALGGFLLSYHQPELGRHFEIGKECDTFRNATELMDRISYYLEHRDERDRIARAGQQRTLSSHLLHHRLDAILRWLRQEGQL